MDEVDGDSSSSLEIGSGSNSEHSEHSFLGTNFSQRDISSSSARNFTCGAPFLPPNEENGNRGLALFPQDKRLVRHMSSPNFCLQGRLVGGVAERSLPSRVTFHDEIHLTETGLSPRHARSSLPLSSSRTVPSHANVKADQRYLGQYSPQSGQDEVVEGFQLMADTKSVDRRDSELRNMESLNLVSMTEDLTERTCSYNSLCQPFAVIPSEPMAKPDRSVDLRSEVLDSLPCERSMNGSLIQQCTDMPELENLHGGRIEAAGGNGEPFSNYGRERFLMMEAGYRHSDNLQGLLRDRDDLLRNRDQEIQELKEANYRQSQFIEKMMQEKRLLETAVAEQARIIMSNNSHQMSREPSQLHTSTSFDMQLYETQLATYREDFENEKKERLLAQSSAESLKVQLQTILNELRMTKDKLKSTEDELQRYKNPYRGASDLNNYQCTERSSYNNEASSASGQSKTPLYRKPDHLEPDRIYRTGSSQRSRSDWIKETESENARSTSLSRCNARNYKRHQQSGVLVC